VKIPRWFKGLGALLLLLWVLFNVAYRLGLTTVVVYGAEAPFADQKFDHTLYKIDELHGFLIGSSDDIAVVSYADGTFPFAPVCGSFEPKGRVLNLANYQKDDWVYSQYPQFGGPIATNLKTGQVLSGDAFTIPDDGPADPSQIPAYRENGLTFDPQYLLTPAKVAAGYPKLSTINDSCVTFNLAFFLLFIVMALIGIPLVLLAWRRARAAARTSAPQGT